MGTHWQPRIAPNHFRRTNEEIREHADSGRLPRLLEFYASESRPLNFVNIATAFHRGAARESRNRLPFPAVEYLTDQISRQMTPPDPRHVANILYGLRDQTIAAGRLVLSRMVRYIESCNDVFSAQNVGNALYGLQGQTGNREARAVLQALAPHIQKCKEAFSAQAVGNALYGLQDQANSSQTRAVLQALTPHIQKCKDAFSSQNVGNALYGLQRQSGTQEARAVLLALAPHIRKCKETFTAQNVGNALNGLQSQTESPETRAVLQALAPHIRKCKEPLSAQVVANALYGLERQTDSPEMHAVLEALAPHSQKCKEALATLAAPSLDTLSPVSRADTVLSSAALSVLDSETAIEHDTLSPVSCASWQSSFSEQLCAEVGDEVLQTRRAGLEPRVAPRGEARYRGPLLLSTALIFAAVEITVSYFFR